MGIAPTIALNANVTMTGLLTNGGLGFKTGLGTLTLSGVTDATSSGNMQVQDGSMVISNCTLHRAAGGLRVTAIRPDASAHQAYLDITSSATVSLEGSSVNVRIGVATDPGSSNTVDVFGKVLCSTNNTGALQILGTNGASSNSASLGQQRASELDPRPGQLAIGSLRLHLGGHGQPGQLPHRLGRLLCA